MELWHFEFLEGGPKTRKSAENWRKLDLSILVFIFFAPAPSSVRAQIFSGIALVANVPPEKSGRLGPFGSLRNKIARFAKAISPHKSGPMHFVMNI